MPTHFLNVLDFSADELADLIALARRLKARRAQGIVDTAFAAKTLVMYFEKPSLRTRVSLETAAISLGGGAINLESNDAGSFWARESVADQARVVSGMADLVAMRTYRHDVVVDFARHSRVPVINTLTDHSHPTQAMADVLTLVEEWGEVRGRTLAYFGDGNNVARSLLNACGRFGMNFIHAGPESFRLPAEDLARAKAACPGLCAEHTTDPVAAVRRADALYTDVWASMGQKDQADRRRPMFQPYQVNEALLAHAPAHAVVLHCLPAVRGEEITDGVLDDPSRSRAFEQAENRMHTYRALFPWLLARS